MNWPGFKSVEEIDKQYPYVHWEYVLDADKFPDVYIIRGMEHRRLHFIETGKEIKDEVGFELGYEYPTREEAERVLADMKQNPKFTEEHLSEDRRDWPMPCMEYIGPVVWEETAIIALKPGDTVWMEFVRDERDRLSKEEQQHGEEEKSKSNQEQP